MKNYCRKILSLLLALCMSVTLCQVTAFAAAPVDFDRYQPNSGDYYMVNFNVIGIPQNPVPDNYRDCTIGGEIEYSYDLVGTGCMSSPKYDLGTEVGAYHFPTDEQPGIVELTVFPDPGVKVTGIAKAINGGAPFLYGNISIDEIPTNVYSGPAVTGDLSGIEDDGSYTLYFNIPTTDALNTADDSYFAVKYEAASPDEIPDAPTNLKWTRDEENSAWVLSWDTVAYAEKYRYNVIINYFNHDYSLIADVTNENKLVLSDSEFGMCNAPCDLKVKVSSIKNKVRSENATAPKHNMIMKKDGTEHWNQCSACNYLDAMSRAAHSYGEWIIDTEATAEAPGTKHRECACGYVQYADIDPTDPTHTHNLDTEYSSDATGHWYACSGCDEQVDFAEHGYGDWEITVPATSEANGKKERVCGVCGYVQEGTVIYEGNDTPEDIHNATYPINNPTNGIVKTDKTEAAQDERVSVSVMPGYVAHIFGNNGNEIARINGTGSFIMPGGGVEITAEYPINLAITWQSSYIYSYDSDMNNITVNRTRKQGTVNVNLGKKYAGKSFVIYEGKKSTKVKVTEGVLDANGRITLDVSDGKNYTLVVED